MASVSLSILGRTVNYLLPFLGFLLAGISTVSLATERASRHALIIGVGTYTAPGVESLKGVVHDMKSARSIAAHLGVAKENITELRDQAATNAAIRKAFTDLSARVLPGDRVFVYFSGHGTRWYDSALRKDDCVEAILPSDGKPITNREVAELLEPITQAGDKLIVLLDACHSGGVVRTQFRARSTDQSAVDPDAGLKPRFSSANLSEACSKPANLRTRSLSNELTARGALPQNIVHISTARPNELSLDDETTGGLGTQAFRDCLLKDAKDLDGSGGISIDEVVSCAQAKVNQRLLGSKQFDPHNFVTAGNAKLLPAVFRQQPDAIASVAVAPAPVSSTPVSSTPVAPVAVPTVSVAPVVALDPVATLNDVLAQGDARRSVQVTATKSKIKVGADNLGLTVTSSHDGYLYLVLLGTDKRSFYLLFPNELDGNNRIEAKKPLAIPRPDWAITAQGPAGINHVLALVSESPRNVQDLAKTKVGPFMASLANADGAAKVQWMTGTSVNQGQADCLKYGKDRSFAVARRCSDVFAASLVTVEEIR